MWKIGSHNGNFANYPAEAGMDTYLLKNGEQTGPYSTERLKEMIDSGEVTLDDLAWNSAKPDWLPLSQIFVPASETADKETRFEMQTRRDPILPEDYRVPSENKVFWTTWLALAGIAAPAILASGGLFLFFVLAYCGFTAVTYIVEFYMHLGRGVRVSRKQFPEIHSLVEIAAENLDMTPPKVIIEQSHEVNASAFGFLGNRFVVVTSALVEAMTNEELLAVLGHEFSHIKCGHSEMAILIGPADDTLEEVKIPFLSTLRQLARYAFLFWSRQGEYSCDRGGLLASRNLSASAGALAKLATGKYLFDKFNLEEFLSQRAERAESFLGRIGELFSSHPALVDRIYHLREFFESPVYARLISPKA